MGGGSSVSSGNNDPFRSIFISDNIAYAEAQLASDEKFRQCFIGYVKSGEWVDKLAAYEDEEKAMDGISVWENFGYVLPSDADVPKSLKSSPSFMTTSTFSGDASSRNPSMKFSTRAVPAEGSMWPLCPTNDDIRSILLVALCPFFFASSEYKRICFSNLSMGSSSSSKEEQTQHEQTKTVERSTRLRELLRTAAAKFDSADLDKYLSAPTPTLIADFKKAVTNLPIHIQILEVNGSLKQATSLYQSSGKSGSLSLSKSFRAATSFKGSAAIASAAATSGSEKSGSAKQSGLDALSLQDYTPEQRQLVEKSLYKQTPLKLAVRTGGGQCALRALKPILDPTGNVKYMVNVEALERVKIAQVNSPIFAARQFQQVDDVLLLLSVLVRSE